MDMTKKNKSGTEEEFDISEEKATLTGFDTKIAVAQKIISRLRGDLANLERLLASDAEPADLEALLRHSTSSEGGDTTGPSEGTMLEGVFDGQHMVGSDGHQYIVPPNYASKSKLVEGDILKLTIQPNGTFVYKQIGPIERQRVMGTLVRDEISNDWCVVALGKKYHMLTAAISYHKGDAGDEAVILIPKAAPSKWAALENVIKKE